MGKLKPKPTERVEWPKAIRAWESPFTLGVGLAHGLWTVPNFFLEFSSKKCRVLGILLQRTTYGQKPGSGRGLNRSPWVMKI